MILDMLKKENVQILDHVDDWKEAITVSLRSLEEQGYVTPDYAKGIKYPLADFEITPDVAIVDPQLVESLPIKQVAYTGMDALTHAIEAYVSTLNSPFTDPLAIKAIEMVLDY